MLVWRVIDFQGNAVLSGVRKKLKSFYKKRNLKKHLWALRILMANNQILKPIMYFICTKPVPSSPCMGLKDNIPSITFSGGDTSMIDIILGSLSSDVFERRTSTGSEPFSLFSKPLRYLIYIAKCPNSYRDDLPKNLFKITAQVCKTSISR